MKVDSIELRRVLMPLRSPFETSFGVQTERDALVLRVEGTAPGRDGELLDVEGWGECVALTAPVYSSEYCDGAEDVIATYLAPAIFDASNRPGGITSERVSTVLEHIVGHRMAKGAIEMAILDAELRAAGRSLAEHLGATRDRVPSGVSVGIQPSINELLDVVGAYVDEGYVRIKIKIKPGWDLEPVRAMRERFGDDLPLQVDANSAYTLSDAPLLQRLDEFGLLLIEQPLGEDDLRQHAELAQLMTTPICLDESIVSAKIAADAVVLGATSVINVKPGRVGGYLEARRIHDLARAHGVAVWCGGMLETGLGRAANTALAALPGFTLPGDISASDRFYMTDLTEPFVLEDGHIRVPTGPGIGVTPRPDVLHEFTVHTSTVHP